MIHHQHNFPVADDAGRLLPAFLAVTNIETDNARAIAVNAERVLTARLRDAQFFWQADRKATLESRLERLGTLLFHKRLGSYRLKALRLEHVAGRIARAFFKDEAAAAHAQLGGTPREGRPRHRHGARVHRAAGHDGRPLRPARRPARGRVEGDLLPLPAGRRRAGAAADARGAGRRRGRLGGRLGRRQARFGRQPVRRRRAADRARAIRWRCAGRRRACCACWSICPS